MKKIFVLILYPIFLFYTKVYAQSGSGGAIIPPAEKSGLPNPLAESGVNSIPGLIKKIINWGMTIATPLLTVMVLYGAFMILTAGEKEEQYKKGKKVILYAAIGFAIIILSEGLKELIGNFLEIK